MIYFILIIIILLLVGHCNYLHDKIKILENKNNKPENFSLTIEIFDSKGNKITGEGLPKDHFYSSGK